MPLSRRFLFIFFLTTGISVVAGPMWDMHRSITTLNTRIADTTALKNWLRANRCQVNDHYDGVSFSLEPNLISNSGLILADGDGDEPRAAVPHLDQFKDSTFGVRTRVVGQIRYLDFFELDQTHPRSDGLRNLVHNEQVSIPLPTKSTTLSIGAQIGNQKRFDLNCEPKASASGETSVIDGLTRRWQAQVNEIKRMADLVTKNRCTLTVDSAVTPYIQLHPHMIRLKVEDSGSPVIVVANQPYGIGAGPKFLYGVPESDGIFSIYDFGIKLDLQNASDGRLKVQMSAFEFDGTARSDSSAMTEASANPVPFTLKAGHKRALRLDCAAGN